jgi:dihydroxy-acid dehydratase
MACVSEAIGLALPGSAGAPAPYESRDQYAEKSGEAVMQLLNGGPRPRDIVTRAALENAAVVVAATGGSTNAGLHLPAIANEAGIDFDLQAVADVFKRTPLIADLKPNGRYVAKDLYEVGGVQVVMKELLTWPASASPKARTWWFGSPNRSRRAVAWSASKARWRPRGRS